MEAIYKRRSIRRYTGDPVSREQLLDLISAGMSAPSAGNEQPWHFIVIDDRGLLDRVPDVHPHAQMVRQAPVAILVCGDLMLEKHPGFWVQDCAAATENILIAVASRGLGSVWLGVYPREDRVAGMRKLLDLPDHIVPFALLPVGYPAEKKGPRDDFDISRVRYNGW